MTLEQLAVAVDDASFPLATTQTPEWFSAAGSPGSRLADTAPELAVGAGDAASGNGTQEKLDLVRMYAPELGSDVPPPAAARPAPAPKAEPEPDASARDEETLGMLRELDNLDT